MKLSPAWTHNYRLSTFSWPIPVKLLTTGWKLNYGLHIIFVLCKLACTHYEVPYFISACCFHIPMFRFEIWKISWKRDKILMLLFLLFDLNSRFFYYYYLLSIFKQLKVVQNFYVALWFKGNFSHNCVTKVRLVFL